jgi:hypothetical protein
MRAALISVTGPPSEHAGSGRAVGCWGVQRFSPLSTGLRIRRASGEHRWSAPRGAYNGGIRPRDLPGSPDDGQRWPISRARVAASRRLVRRRRHSVARRRYPGPRHSSPGCARVARPQSRMTSSMTAPAGVLCDHCLLPIGPRPMRRMVNGESRAFCCYGCCIAYQVKGGNSVSGRPLGC